MIIEAIICQGLQDASGLSEKKQSISEEGNLRLQDRALIAKGFNLRDYLGIEPFWGTLNCYIGTGAIDPLKYSKITHEDRTLAVGDRQMDPATTTWDIKMYDIKWHQEKEPENIFFLKGSVKFKDADFPCSIYFPNPKGSTATYHPSTIIEIIAPPLPFDTGKVYGQIVRLSVPDGSLMVKPASRKLFTRNCTAG